MLVPNVKNLANSESLESLCLVKRRGERQFGRPHCEASAGEEEVNEDFSALCLGKLFGRSLHIVVIQHFFLLFLVFMALIVKYILV